MAAISPARKAAFQILMAIERGPAHSDDLLRGKHVSALSPADMNLTTALVLGILRWQIQLDAEIKKYLNKPNARLDAEVLIALRIGAFQLLHLERIPARAAIDESVELAKQAGHRFASGMVNAVLRKLSIAHGSKFEEGTAPEIAMIQAHPQWIVDRWVAAYGFPQACAICRHDQSQPETTLRISASGVEADLAEAGLVTKPGELLVQARRLVSGDVTAAFREGRIFIQDEGSQLVAEIAAFVGGQFEQGSSIQGSSILDACAAPGGKTLILLERNPGAHVVACEVSEQRFAQLQKRLTHFADRLELRHADATALEDPGRFDLVLADVPCSGTGTLGRNPEIRHRLHAEDFERQAGRQRAILAAALRAAKPGGQVVYSTCSVEAEENDAVIAGVLAQYPGARQLSLSQILEKMERAEILKEGAAERLSDCLTPEGALRIIPGPFGTDGFFIALLQAVDPAK
jgi:16S rRNA (cytosine967-C5)-methyltransferase